jgi:hypothetical protein
MIIINEEVEELLAAVGLPEPAYFEQPEIRCCS